MKTKITCIDEKGKRTKLEAQAPAKDHLLAQQKYPATVRKNKKKAVPSKYVHIDILDPETGAKVGCGTMIVGEVSFRSNDDEKE